MAIYTLEDLLDLTNECLNEFTLIYNNWSKKYTCDEFDREYGTWDEFKKSHSKVMDSTVNHLDIHRDGTVDIYLNYKGEI